MNRELTCIVCPIGCSLTVELENGEVKNVSGNTCPRGALYAKNECTNPQRTVTSTVRCIDGGMVSVKTDGTIPKGKINECMNVINSLTPDLPIRIGDVLLEDVFGVKLVATQNRGRNNE